MLLASRSSSSRSMSFERAKVYVYTGLRFHNVLRLLGRITSIVHDVSGPDIQYWRRELEPSVRGHWTARLAHTIFRWSVSLELVLLTFPKFYSNPCYFHPLENRSWDWIQITPELLPKYESQYFFLPWRPLIRSHFVSCILRKKWEKT